MRHFAAPSHNEESKKGVTCTEDNSQKHRQLVRVRALGVLPCAHARHMHVHVPASMFMFMFMFMFIVRVHSRVHVRVHIAACSGHLLDKGVANGLRNLLVRIE